MLLVRGITKIENEKSKAIKEASKRTNKGNKDKMKAPKTKSEYDALHAKMTKIGAG